MFIWRCNKNPDRHSPLCKHFVRKLIPVRHQNHFRQDTLKISSENFLTFVNPVLPARAEHMRDYRCGGSLEARTENNIDTTHSAPRVRLFGTIQ